MMWSLAVWSFQSMLLLAVFHFLVPPIIHMATGNRWSKLPLMVAGAVLAAGAMVWMGYYPYVLFFAWIALTRGTIQQMEQPTFAYRIRPPVYYVSSYVYVALACLLALALQAEVSLPDGSWTPLWRKFLPNP